MSAPGYIGSDSESELVKKIKAKPNSVVLFDEIEKAHPKVFDTLLNILDCGEMTDNHKNRVSFRNAIIIFTTNLGYTKDSFKKKPLGFVQSSKTETDNEVIEAIKDKLRPEFINRVDQTIVFNRLDNSIADQLIERYTNEFNERSKLDVSLTEEDFETIKKDAQIEEYGARGLNRSTKKIYMNRYLANVKKITL